MSMNLVYQTLERVDSNFREFLTRGPKPKGPNGDGQVRTHKKGKKPKSTEAGSEASPPAKPNRDQLLNSAVVLQKNHGFSIESLRISANAGLPANTGP